MGSISGSRQLSALLADGAIRTIADFYRCHSWIPRNLKDQRLNIPLEGSLEESVARINRFQPDVIHGYGSWLGALFRQVWERNLPLCCPKVVNYFADRMADADRLLIEEKFGVPVISTYGATESLHIGFQCERREGFHLIVNAVAFRVIDEQGKTQGPGGIGNLYIIA
jgi:phenylacetate-coenzyme A ligase PaaK-like adenylate-forming protein